MATYKQLEHLEHLEQHHRSKGNDVSRPDLRLTQTKQIQSDDKFTLALVLVLETSSPCQDNQYG